MQCPSSELLFGSGQRRYAGSSWHAAGCCMCFAEASQPVWSLRCVSVCSALIKVMLAYEHQTLPANLHFTTPNPNNAGLKDGILKVVTEPTEFKQGVVALSNFGFGGERLLSKSRLPQ